jgi:hypothetical protein
MLLATISRSLENRDPQRLPQVGRVSELSDQGAGMSRVVLLVAPYCLKSWLTTVSTWAAIAFCPAGVG